MRRHSLRMLRESLLDVPQFPLPDGYALADFRPGDWPAWLAVQRSVYPEQVLAGSPSVRELAARPDALARRAVFLLDATGRPAGSVTAWFARCLGRRWGRVHWLAVVPAHQGRGLSRPLLAAALARLAALGHRRAMLTTQAHRLRAIRTYLRFGFRPDRTFTPDAPAVWDDILRRLGRPRSD